MGIHSARQKLPEVITLGASRYTIVPKNKEWFLENQCHGQCRWPAMEVDIVVDQSDTELANTIIHECLHLCYREWQIKPRCGEERTVTGLGFALSALWAQNPDIVEYISNLLET